MAEFIKQFYDQAPIVPAAGAAAEGGGGSQDHPPVAQPDAAATRRWRSWCRAQGQQHELIQMAAENAAETLRALQAQWQADTHRQEQALAELQAALGLAQPRSTASNATISPTPRARPRWAAWWSSSRACPRRSCYRRFNIRSVSGPDDFASMEEVLTRRFNRWKAAQERQNSRARSPTRPLPCCRTC